MMRSFLLLPLLLLPICIAPTARGGIVRASVSATGEQGDKYSLNPSLSADGRFVAFHSDATNFVPGDTNNNVDVFVKDLQTGAITLASVSVTGEQGNGGSSYPSVSADGRFVAFSSRATNLVPGDTNSWEDVFVKDLQMGAITRVSVSATGEQGDKYSLPSSLSADGRFVAFTSAASNLVPGDTNRSEDVFLTENPLIRNRLGDVNGDGGIDVQDAVLVLRFAKGVQTPTEAQKAAGDVNQDTLMEVTDAVLILRHIVFGTPLG